MGSYCSALPSSPNQTHAVFLTMVAGRPGRLAPFGLGPQRLDILLTMTLYERGGTESAAFSEYLIAKADLAITVPENLTFEEAATLGVGLSTVVSCVLF